jgi:tRNA (adenine57-N1/adenine58-N1)-methyltransferase
VLLIDAKDRRYLITLVPGASFHTHAGIVAHDEVIGRTEGSRVAGSTSRSFLVLRPTLSDVVLKMPRGAQVIYPKDLGAILLAADLAPGQRVLEAGVGSGALSLTALRAGVDLVGYEIREDFAARARANVAAHLGPLPPERYRVEVRDVTEGIDERGLDRVLLDLPEPERVVAGAAVALRPGGILLAYLPTINQTALVRAALEQAGFGLAETVEILRRTWHVEPRSVRPDHRMVAHTGFLTTARRLADQPGEDALEGVSPAR